MTIDCQEYRKTMELLALRLRLQNETPNPEELEEIQEKIRILEKELKVD